MLVLVDQIRAPVAGSGGWSGSPPHSAAMFAPEARGRWAGTDGDSSLRELLEALRRGLMLGLLGRYRVVDGLGEWVFF